jgi:hypothetical protein
MRVLSRGQTPEYERQQPSDCDGGQGQAACKGHRWAEVDWTKFERKARFSAGDGVSNQCDEHESGGLRLRGYDRQRGESDNDPPNV